MTLDVFKIVFYAAAAALCLAVFFTALFMAFVVASTLQSLAGTDRMGPNGIAAMRLVGQLGSVLAAMAATYATFAGLRWVWRGFRLR